MDTGVVPVLYIYIYICFAIFLCKRLIFITWSCITDKVSSCFLFVRLQTRQRNKEIQRSWVMHSQALMIVWTNCSDVWGCPNERMQRFYSTNVGVVVREGKWSIGFDSVVLFWRIGASSRGRVDCCSLSNPSHSLHSLSHLGFPLLLLTLTPSHGKRLPSKTNIEKVFVDFKDFRKNSLQVWPSFPSPILKLQSLSWLLINARWLRNECLMHLCLILYPGSIGVIYGTASMANDGVFFSRDKSFGRLFLQCSSQIVSTLYHGTIVKVSMSVWLFLIDCVWAA